MNDFATEIEGSTEIPLSEPIINIQWDNGKLSLIEFSPELWDLPEYELLAELALICKAILTEHDLVKKND